MRQIGIIAFLFFLLDSISEAEGIRGKIKYHALIGAYPTLLVFNGEKLTLNQDKEGKNRKCKKLHLPLITTG